MSAPTPPVPLTPLEPWIAAKTGCSGQPLSLDALRAYQLAKLNATLSLAQEKSPFYRRLFGIKKVSLSCLDDLANLPFSTADQIGAAPFDFLCVRQDDVERIVTLPTSGTTGTPKRICFTAEDQELTRDFFHWGMSTMVEAGDRVLILLPGSLPGSVGDLLKEGLARMDVQGIPHGPVTDARRTLEMIEKERVTALVGIPVQVLELARLSETVPAGTRRRGAGDRGRPFEGLHSVLLSTDRMPRAVARVIEEAWGCAVYNHYGMTEMGLGGGVDCRARAGYHVREADLFFEIVDPTTGRPVPEGSSGEVVFTTLTRRAMPLIRYRTGDVSRFVPGPCPCGTVLRRLAHVDERLAGGISLPSGDTVHQRDFDEALFPVDGLADFRVLFSQGEGQATIVVRVRSYDASRRPDDDEIVQALSSVLPLSDAMARGELSVEVLDWDTGDGNNTGTGKRRILHLQGATR
jgi:phenylacetate-CoA ligase